MIVKQIILLLGNTAMFAMWLQVLITFLRGEIDEESLGMHVKRALAVSCIELVNSLCGLTRSKPHHVLLFAVVRTGVEFLLAPLLPFTQFEHIWTIVCWATGEVFRFGCFALDAFFSICSGGAKESNGGVMVKSVRYTVGPIMFPLGAGGEMFMCIRAARNARPMLFLAASLWPAGFYPLMKQLLKQRKKHFQKMRDDKKDK